MLITNATILTPHERIEKSDVLIEEGKIAAVGAAAARPQEAETLDARGLLLAPGFIDLQINGGFGCDFTRAPHTMWEVAAKLPRYGVTSFLPTIITSPPQTIASAQEVVTSPPADHVGAAPLGLHVEGPFLNPQKKGAHNEAYLQTPDEKLAAGWSPQSGVRLVTLAPELPGALDLVRRLRDRGVVVSAGHSMATYEEAQAGFEAGVAYGTHLFNAMPRLHHRQPGLAGAILHHERVRAGLIADGVHVHAALVQLAWKALGPGRLTLVSDAMAALGMPPGDYVLGDLAVTVDERRATLSDGTLAGSILTMDAALRHLLHFTACSLTEALQTMTSTPAHLLGLGAQKGRIAAGFDADLVLMMPDLEIVATFAAGKRVYERDDSA